MDDWDNLSFGSLGLGGGGLSPALAHAQHPLHLRHYCSSSDNEVETSPQLVYQSDSTAIYRLYEIGFKVVLTPNPSEVQILKLLHEQKISNFLPWSCRKRVVTDVTSFNKRPALSFKWASGITLKEWLQKVEVGPSVDLNVRLRAAMAIAKTLSTFHEGGVVYNCLTPENIVLAPVEGEYVATLIDLSSALIYRDESRRVIDPSFEKQVKENDLKSLGSVFNQLFQGDVGVSGEVAGQAETGSNIVEYVEGEQDHCRPKRGKQQSQREGLPFYLGALISALLDVPTSSELRYESAKDVFLDLKIIADSADDSCYRKSKLDEFNTKSRLKPHGDMFYGRTVQMSMLLHLFQSSVALGDQPLMATISGYPGTGKSSLVNQIKKPLLDLNGFFIEGKFDKGAHPDTVLASAINSFFGRILEANGGSLHMSMKWRIHDAIGSGSNNVLLEILPNLQKWMADDSVAAYGTSLTSLVVKGIGLSHRLKFMFCKLIGAIACRAHPLILFLDDLQWADEITLDIIRMTMTDLDIRHFLFLGCYRDNEVIISHQLKATLNAIQEQGINIVTIKVGPIERECVNTLLSEMLCLPPSLCQPLSTAVYSKTGGIMLFILRFLASLNYEGDLWFSMSARRWMYNLEEIGRKEMHGDVVSHMTEHMKNLSRKMRTGLKVSACLGHKFDAQVLEKAKKGDEFEDSFLDECVEFGFLQKCGSSHCVWAHDQIQQAAYDLIPLPKRESFHLLLGSRLYITALPSDMHRMIFFIVDNMNRGAKLIDDLDQRYEVSQLNFEAGEKALSSSAFHSAVKYLMMGISLLGSKSWEMKYDLSIKLYDAASEALFNIGDFTRLSILVDESLTKARSFNDKLNQLNNVVRSLAASSRFEEGIAECLGILFQLGERIPNEVTDDVIQGEVTQVKLMLHGKSRKDLLSLHKMSDENKLASMQFMNHILSMGYITNPKLNIIIVFRMVKMSIEHGICNISAFAFACYGALLINEPCYDIEGGHMMGRVATEMTAKLGADEMIPRLYASVYGLINIWKEPWQAALAKHLEAYTSGSTTGDVEYAVINLYYYVNMATFGGCEDLESCSENIQLYIKRAFQCNQRAMSKSLVILHQLVLDLRGIEENAFLSLSNTMTEDSCFVITRQNKEKSMCRLMCCKKKYVAFFTGDLNMAAEMYELCRQFPIESVGRLVSAISSIFIDGMIGFFVARKQCEDETKWTHIGLDAIATFRKWIKNSEWNFANKLNLLEGEFYFWKGDSERAIISYNNSIKAAHEHRFVNEEGLAEEKLAAFFLHESRHDEAICHLNNAKKCYEAWGAKVLVDRVNKAIKMLLPMCSKEHTLL